MVRVRKGAPPPFRLLKRGEPGRLPEGEPEEPRADARISSPYVVSPFAFHFRSSGYDALYHSLSQALVYGDERLGAFFTGAKNAGAQRLDAFLPLLSEERSAERLLLRLVDEELLVPAQSDLSAPLRALEESPEFRPHISILYLLVTNECNLRCRYCTIESGARKPPGFRHSHMPAEMAGRGIDLFFDLLDEKTLEPTIIYYGGEPLLNASTFIESARYIREKMKRKRFRRLEPKLSAVLNGTLVTEKLARQLKSLGVTASVSLDGLEHHHDRMRVYRGGGGSWEDALRGYLLMRKFGGGCGISCTLGPHNWEEIEEIAEFFAARLECRGLGFNILKGLPPESGLEVPAGRVTEKIVSAFEIFRRYGVYEDRIMRKVRSFSARTHWFHDCGGYGGQIALCPDGSVGPCHVAADDGRFLWGFIDDEDISRTIMESGLTRDWCRRSPVFFEECRSCEALAVCGGGCAEEAYVKKGDINAMDDSFCEHAKALLRWLIDDLSRTLRSEGKR